MLNLFTSSPAELRTAFDTLEGKGFYERSLARDDYLSLGYVVGLALQDEERLKGMDDCGGVNVYGRGGGHRYFIMSDGTIRFSIRHSLFSKHDDVERFGFLVF